MLKSDLSAPTESTRSEDRKAALTSSLETSPAKTPEKPFSTRSGRAPLPMGVEK